MDTNERREAHEICRDRYLVSYHCRNCQRASQQHFAKGEPAPDNATCPHCGCGTAGKTGSLVMPPPSSTEIPPRSFAQDMWRKRPAAGTF